MAPIDVVSHAVGGGFPVAHAGGVRAPATVFDRIFTVFLGLGTLVGVVVCSYTLYNAYKYRAGSGNGAGADVTRPTLGEIPQGGGGGKKLFVSFFLSAAIVLGLILWTYSTLLYIETGPASSQQAQSQAIASASSGAPARAGVTNQAGTANQAGTPNETRGLNPITIDVVGHRFSWEFVYPNGETTFGTMRVPQDRLIRINVTSADVFHNIGVPGLRVKADAIPGQYTRAWFVAHDTGDYPAHCYELCGAGHARMDATVKVLPQDSYDRWYDTTGNETGNETGDSR